MLVISDTSPISSLIQIGRSELLRDLFGEVCIPPAVSGELARFHASIPQYITVRTISDPSRVSPLLSSLDLGEAEAIALAAECHADYLLIDERRGRHVAAQQGIPTIGLVGVLLLAKQRQLVVSIKDCLSELQAVAGFYISDALKQRVLEAANE
jgi:predicted nucleic acid-binding protein